MATNLIVRNVAPEIVKSLKEQAARNGRSAEAEHRAILEAALRRPHRRPLNEILASMPDVGRDSDFEFRRE
jgi:antitoxin FitA